MKAEKRRGWTKLERMEVDCIWLNLKNVGPFFFKLAVSHLHSWKIILSCNVVMILQMKDSWSANLKFRAHN